MPSDAERRQKALDFLSRFIDIPEDELPRNAMALVQAAKVIIESTQPKTPTGALFVPTTQPAPTPDPEPDDGTWGGGPTS